MKSRDYCTILIPDGEKDYVHNVVYCLKSAGRSLKLIVCSRRGDSLCRYSRFVDEFILLEGATDVDWVSLIDIYSVDFVMPVSEDGIKTVFGFDPAIASRCAIAPLPPEASLNIALNKWEQYKAFSAREIPMPKTRQLSDGRPDKVDYPLLVKPRAGALGIGIRLLQAEEDWDQSAFKDDYIVQSYVPGYDIDCSVLCDKGRIVAYTIQRPLLVGSGFGPNIGHLHFTDNQSVLSIAEQVVQALEWQGVAHLDLRYDADKNTFCLIEFNPRFWASVAASLSAGINFPALCVSAGLGEQVLMAKPRTATYMSATTWLRAIFSSGFNLPASNTNLASLLTDPIPLLLKIGRRIQRLNGR